MLNLCSEAFHIGEQPKKVLVGRNFRQRERLGLQLEHLLGLIVPSRHLPHLLQGVLLSLLPIHPVSLHRQINRVFKFLLEGNKFTLQVSALNTVRIVSVLTTMIIFGGHWPSATLTFNGQRQSADQEEHDSAGQIILAGRGNAGPR